MQIGVKLEVSENKFTHAHLMLKSKKYFLNCNYVLKVYNVTLLDLFILTSKREIKKPMFSCNANSNSLNLKNL